MSGSQSLQGVSMSLKAESLNRRQLIVGAAALSILGNASSAVAAPVPATVTRRDLSKADIDSWMKELSNWGRWGKDDQAGTINLITPAKRRQAASLVKDGVSVSLSL